MGLVLNDGSIEAGVGSFHFRRFLISTPRHVRCNRDLYDAKNRPNVAQYNEIAASRGEINGEG